MADASDFLPGGRSRKALREAAASCRGCQRARRGARARRHPARRVTYVVKHFKFKERGKRRIHDTPKKGEVDACLPWLREELRLVRPEVLVFLGATAAKALLGSSFRLTRTRGEEVESDLAPHVAATIHPAAILRAPDGEARQAEREAFTRDLEAVARMLGA